MANSLGVLIQLQYFLEGCGVPETSGFVVACRKDKITARRIYSPVHRASMACGDFLQCFSSFCVPQLDRRIRARRYDYCLIRREICRCHGAMCAKRHCLTAADFFQTCTAPTNQQNVTGSGWKRSGPDHSGVHPCVGNLSPRCKVPELHNGFWTLCLFVVVGLFHQTRRAEHRRIARNGNGRRMSLHAGQNFGTALG